MFFENTFYFLKTPITHQNYELQSQLGWFLIDRVISYLFNRTKQTIL